MSKTNRLCFALDLKDDAGLIAEYERYHRAENTWPEVTKSISSAGIEMLEIYRINNRLFMIMEVNDSFDPEVKAQADSGNPFVQEWEELMWKFQQPLPQAEPGEKWLSARCIYRLKDVL